MDEALITRAQRGDLAAVEALLQEIAPLVYRFGMRMCRHEADAEDVLQDTLLSVAHHLGEYQGRSSLASWVFTLARTACARKRRGRKNQPHLPAEAASAVRAEGASPEDAADSSELRNALENALASLSDEQREVLLLRDMEGLTAPETAQSLGLSVDAVKSRLHRARAALREALKGTLEAHAPPFKPGCPDVLAAFSRKLEGDLDGLDCEAMEKHVAACTSCGATCDALRTALTACRREASLPVPPRVQQRVKDALRRLI